jgi:hypothetical protein
VGNIQPLLDVEFAKIFFDSSQRAEVHLIPLDHLFRRFAIGFSLRVTGLKESAES